MMVSVNILTKSPGQGISQTRTSAQTFSIRTAQIFNAGILAMGSRSERVSLFAAASAK
jgi:hypothetical protein